MNPKTGKWGQAHTSMGALGDSFYEYLLKEWIRSGKRDMQVRCIDKRVLLCLRQPSVCMHTAKAAGQQKQEAMLAQLSPALFTFVQYSHRFLENPAHKQGCGKRGVRILIHLSKPWSKTSGSKISFYDCHFLFMFCCGSGCLLWGCLAGGEATKQEMTFTQCIFASHNHLHKYKVLSLRCFPRSNTLAVLLSNFTYIGETV